MIRKLEKLFNEKVRPALASHGGNVEIVDVTHDTLYLRLHGGCQGCSSSLTTVKGGIEKLVFDRFPNITQVIDITDHTSGQNPYM